MNHSSWTNITSTSPAQHRKPKHRTAWQSTAQHSTAWHILHGPSSDAVLASTVYPRLWASLSRPLSTCTAPYARHIRPCHAYNMCFEHHGGIVITSDMQVMFCSQHVLSRRVPKAHVSPGASEKAFCEAKQQFAQRQSSGGHGTQVCHCSG